MPVEEYRTVRLRAKVNIEGLRRTATILRSKLPQSNLGLWVLRRESIGASWRLSRRVVGQDVDQEPQEELDLASGQVRIAIVLPT